MDLIEKLKKGWNSESLENTDTPMASTDRGRHLSSLLSGVDKQNGTIAGQKSIEERKSNLISKGADFLRGLIGLKIDSLTNIINIFPSRSEIETMERQGNAISASDNVTIHSNFKTGTSIGDLSWLIYKNRLSTNSEMLNKWSLYKDTTTLHGYNSRIYIDEGSKQIAITLEGTQADKESGSVFLSKDGVADLEIGLGVIPPQMREGYKEFKEIMKQLQNDFGAEYSISVAGHSLGGGLAQMMSGMYYIDTGIALPTLAEAGPGMLRQLKMYAQQQLIAGETIFLPNGTTMSLADKSLAKRIDMSKAIVETFSANDFSNIINLITIGDPVGFINYDEDAKKDGHVGISIEVPYLLTAREHLMDERYENLKKLQSMNLTTPDKMPDTLLGLLSGLDNISITRFDRHEPEQSITLWSGDIVKYNPLYPEQAWSGSSLGLPEATMFGSNESNCIETGNEATIVIAGDGNDTIYAGSGGNILAGGLGNDTIYGGSGDDYLAGEAGNDTLYGIAGNNILYGGAGNDILIGGSGNDLLFGGDGDDILVWQNGNDILCGNAGDDTFIINDKAAGQMQIKWERNYINFGNDSVFFGGKLAENSTVLFNFADEIKYQDMKWSQSGSDIIMTDTLGNKNASVTFKNAFDSFANNSNQLLFSFTNGKAYVDDTLYNVVAGSGDIKAENNKLYNGSILVGSINDNVLYSGFGNDLLFGNAGKNTYVFDINFGNDQIIGSTNSDIVKFNDFFDMAKYTILKSTDDLVISYQDTVANINNSLTIANWSYGENLNSFKFNDGDYKIEKNSFVKIS